LVQVNGAIVGEAMRGRLIHSSDQPPGRFFDDPHWPGGPVAPQANPPGWVAAPSPMPSGLPEPKVPVVHELLGSGPGRPARLAEQVQVGLGERKLRGGRGQVRGEDIRVRRIQGGGLRGPQQQGLRVPY
jgi:hypothetical protein